MCPWAGRKSRLSPNWALGPRLGVTQESERMASCLESEGGWWESVSSLSEAEETLGMQQPCVSGPGTSHGSPCWGWDGGTQGLAPSVCSRCGLATWALSETRAPPVSWSLRRLPLLHGRTLAKRAPFSAPPATAFNPASDEAVIQQRRSRHTAAPSGVTASRGQPSVGWEPSGSTGKLAPQTARPFPLGPQRRSQHPESGSQHPECGPQRGRVRVGGKWEWILAGPRLPTRVLQATHSKPRRFHSDIRGYL